MDLKNIGVVSILSLTLFFICFLASENYIFSKDEVYNCSSELNTSYYPYFEYKPNERGNINNPLVWAFAYGYKWDKMSLFIKSLRNNGYNGDLVIAVSSKLYNSLYNKVKKYNILPIIIEDKWPFYSSKNAIFPVNYTILKKYMIGNRRIGGYKWNIYRFSILLCWLLVYGSKYSHIMSLDVRDIVFQGNPFKWNFEDGLYVVDEIKHNDYLIARSKANFKWVKPYKNYKKMICNKILNSGTIFGSKSYFISFIKQFNQFLENDKNIIAEQGSLNYAYYTGYFKNIKFLMNKNRRGVILTLAVEYSLYLKDTLSLTVRNYTIYNEDETIPLIIHQYDRYKHIESINQMKYLGKLIDKE